MKVWECTQFGNVPLYLLDANLPENPNRLITGQLYGWFGEERLAQEIILGVGGVKALEALGITPDVYHFNDSHPVIAGLELIRRKMTEGMSFDDAWAATRNQIVFTTHTPVVAGNESYDYRILKYMGVFGTLTKAQMQAIGGKKRFSMTEAGLRLSRLANGVAQLHGKTAKSMWSYVDGGSDIIAITNGVHNGTWQNEGIRSLSGDSLFKRHTQLKRAMLDEVEKRTGVKLREDVLTIGFARRAAGYKRSDLIFRGGWADELLKSGKLQIVFAGKAHPNDLGGKQIISNLVHKAGEYPQSVVFLQDYDMTIGAMLTRGCDVWLNNPIRPMEASGTSGMKAAMNGVLNVSVLDGWWPEACRDGENGWQIGGGYEGDNCDEVDGESLRKTLLNKVIPTYYDDRAKWTDMMKQSIDDCSEKFSAARMVNEYYDRMYDNR